MAGRVVVKHPLLPLAALAVMALVGCSKDAPVSVQNATEATIDNLEAQANALEAEAAAQVNAAGASDLANAQATFDASYPIANATVTNMN